LPSGRNNSERPRLFLTRRLPEAVMARLKGRFILQYNSLDRPLSGSEIRRGIADSDGLISMLNDRIDRDVIGSAPRLRIISNYAAGYNNIDLTEAARREIVVTNTPGVLTETTADLAWALILSTARRLPEAERVLRSGTWTGWAPTHFLGSDVHGKTLGIFGLGRIGKAVARRAAGFSMKVVYHNRHRLSRAEEKRLGVRYVSESSLLKTSDFISLHLPLTPASRHLIDRPAFGKMKPGAILINTARGPVIDENALVRALAAGRVAGAGLDVFEDEPRVGPRLRRMRQVVLLPHIGSASGETRNRMGMMVLENLLAFFGGGNPPNRVA
jgi:glyoxylate reductase